MFSLVQPRVRWLVSRVTGDMVLDIGFLGTKGEPLVHRTIRSGASGRVIGFDIASEVLTCREPDSVVGDVQFLPFVAGSFDTVVLGEFVEHFECLKPILTEVQRVLVRGGRLVLTTPNPYSWPRWLKHWLLAVSPGRAENVQAFLYVRGHLVLWEPLSLCNLLRMYGLEPLEVTTRHQVVPLLARVLPLFGRLDWRFFPFNRIGLYTCIVACRV
jgi:SAM-dependent methyltransferase